MFWQLVVLSLVFSSIDSRPLSRSESEQLLKVCGTRGASLSKRQGPIPPSKKKIGGGVRATAWDAPWAARVHFGHSKVCGGTLISSRHILTATHCLTLNRELDAITRGAQVDCIHDIVYTSANGSVQETRGGINQVWNGYFPLVSVYFADGTRSSATVIRMNGLNICMSDQYNDDLMVLELDNDVIYSNYLLPACVSTSINGNLPGSKADIYANDYSGALTRASFQISRSLNYGKMFESLDPTRRYSVGEEDVGAGNVKRIDGRITVVGAVSKIGSSFILNSAVGYYSHNICTFAGICPGGW